MTQIDLKKYALFLFVCLCLIQPLLLPPIPLFSLGNLFLPFATAIVTIEFWKDKLFRIGLIAFGIIVVTTLISDLSKGGLTTSEVLWSLRWMKLFVLIWSGYYLSKMYPNETEWLIKTLFLLIVLINGVQLMKIGTVVEFYAGKTETSEYSRYALYDSRIFGTAQNPNNNALMMTLFILFFYFSKIRWKYWFIALGVILVIMTQSRTGFIATSSLLGISLLVKIFRNNKKQLLLITVACAALVLVLWGVQLHYLTDLFDGTAFQSSSFLGRFEVIHEVMELNQSNIWLGQGKVVSIPELIGMSIDNEFAYIFLEYGIVGTAAFLIVIGYLAYLGYKKLQTKMWLGFLVAMIICGLTNVAFTNTECGVLFFTLFLVNFGGEKDFCRLEKQN